jgi:ABC-type Na+ efflux pump permease subunit
MFPGVMALLERSLRVDARAWGPHLARFGLMTAIYISVIVAVEAGLTFGAPGLRFFGTVAYLDLTFMTLLGISFFSTAITEEKEEDTLGLMLMAGISPLGILLGKSGGRLAQALLLVAVQYPFTLLAVTMGGITQAQVQATFVALFAYLIMLSGIGLLFSTVAHRSQTAATCLLLAVIAYWGVPASCILILANFRGSLPPIFAYILEYVSHSSVFFQMGTVLTTGYNESVFTRQVVTNFSAGGLGFLLSWALFGLAARQPSSEASSRELLSRPIGHWRWFSPGRPGEPFRLVEKHQSSRVTPIGFERLSVISNPIAWKDFYFVAGGQTGVLIRLAVFASIYLFCYEAMNDFFIGNMRTVELKSVTRLYLGLSMLAVSLDAGMLVSRSLHAEIRSQTLASLFLLPISPGRILYSKIGGTLLAWLASAACLFGGTILLPGGVECFHDFLDFQNRTQLFQVWFVSLLLLLPHVAAAFALYVRWGAFPLAIACTIGCLMLEVTIFSSQRVLDSPIVALAALGNFFICGMCHVVLRVRVEELASK